MQFSPKSDELTAESTSQIFIVGFGGDVRRKEGVRSNQKRDRTPPTARFDFNAILAASGFRYDLSTPTILFHTFEIFFCELHRQEYLFPSLQPTH